MPNETWKKEITNLWKSVKPTCLAAAIKSFTRLHMWHPPLTFVKFFFWNVIIDREIVHSQFKLEISPPEGSCIISHGIEW